MPAYRTSDGAPLRFTYGPHAGSPMADCCCPEEEPENNCNGCDPKLSDTFTATISGLTGYFSSYNGSYSMVNTWGYCQWSNAAGNLTWTSLGGTSMWVLEFYFGGEQVVFVGSTDPCSPAGSYTYYESSPPTAHEADKVGSSAVVS